MPAQRDTKGPTRAAPSPLGRSTPLVDAPSLADTESPRARLLAATVACIEEHGLPAVTSRLIATKAGQNAAAVNYYFGSKDHLVEQALELTRREGFEHPLRDYDALVDGGSSPRRALRQVLGQLLVDSTHYPKVAFAHLRPVLEDQRYDGVSVSQLHQFLEALASRLTPALTAPLPEAALRARLAQIWAVVAMTAMAPGLFSPFTGLDLADSAQRELFLDALLTGLPIA